MILRHSNVFLHVIDSLLVCHIIITSFPRIFEVYHSFIGAITKIDFDQLQMKFDLSDGEEV